MTAGTGAARSEQFEKLRKRRQRKGESGEECDGERSAMEGELLMRLRRLQRRTEALLMRRILTRVAGVHCGASKRERLRGLEQRARRMREERMRRVCLRQRTAWM